MKELSQYDLQANNFLVKANATLEIVRSEIVDRFPGETTATGCRWSYNCKFRRNGKTYTFKFYDSIDNYRKDERPTKYDVLACLEKYPVENDTWDFANEFGYSISTKEEYKRVERIKNACNRQFNKLLELFGYDLMNELQEIC